MNRRHTCCTLGAALTCALIASGAQAHGLFFSSAQIAKLDQVRQQTLAGGAPASAQVVAPAVASTPTTTAHPKPTRLSGYLVRRAGGAITHRSVWLDRRLQPVQDPALMAVDATADTVLVRTGSGRWQRLQLLPADRRRWSLQQRPAP